MKKLLLAALLLAGCGGPGQECYDNNTCDGDLVCVKLGALPGKCFTVADIHVTKRDGIQRTVGPGSDLCK